MRLAKAFATALLLSRQASGRSECSAPTDLPATSYPGLHNPFTFFNGTPVATTDDWRCRRAEIIDSLNQYELGAIGGIVPELSGSLSGNVYTVTMTAENRTITIPVTIYYPVSFPPSDGPFPAMIELGGSTVNVPKTAGVAFLAFDNLAVASHTTRGVGSFYTLFGKDHPAGAVRIWAWTVSRILDLLVLDQEVTNIDPTKVGVTGCSMNARGALFAGALDERIALTIPMESGTGGVGCWRIADRTATDGSAPTVETAATLASMFAPHFTTWTSAVDYLPYDHHLVLALIAPRGLLILENTALDRLGPQSVYGCSKAAVKVFEALGVADNLGFSQVGHADHCEFQGLQYPEYVAFVIKFLRGFSEQNTKIFRTDSPNQNGWVEEEWIEWTAPVLVNSTEL